MYELLKNIKEKAYLTGNFVTRSGKKTSYYIDKYLIETEPRLLKAICEKISELLPENYDRIAAPELGAVALASVVSIMVNKPFIIVRKDSKEYGTKKLLEGQYKVGERVVIIEDILTTGGAVIRAGDILVENGLNVIKIIGVINREEGAKEAIQKKGWDMAAVFCASQLHSM